MTVLFFVLLKVDIISILRSIQNWWLTLYVAAMNLLLVPLGFYFVLESFSAEYALAIALIVAAPAGMASATLSDLLHGNTAMAAGLTIVTSLATPFTLPLVVSIAAQESVEVGIVEMIASLAVTVFVPMALAQGVKRWFVSAATRLERNVSSINVLLLFALVYIAVAAQQKQILDGLNRFIWQLAVMFIVYLALHVIGFILIPNAKFADKLSSAITLAYTNIGISIIVASEFFSAEVLVLVVLSEIPWVMCLGPFKAAINWHASRNAVAATHH